MANGNAHIPGEPLSNGMVRTRSRLEEAEEDPELRQILNLVPLAKDEVQRRFYMNFPVECRGARHMQYMYANPEKVFSDLSESVLAFDDERLFSMPVSST